jgi:hypothetical protein
MTNLVLYLNWNANDNNEFHFHLDRAVLVRDHEEFTFVRFQVLTAANMKMAVLGVVEPCSLVEVHRRFRCACCLHN